MAIDIAAAVFALRPRDHLDLDAAVGTIHPPHGVGKKDGDVPDGDKCKQPGVGHVVVAGTQLAATGASWLAVGPRDDVGNDPPRVAFSGQCDGIIDEALEMVDLVE